jgi:hypothetical protein
MTFIPVFFRFFPYLLHIVMRILKMTEDDKQKLFFQGVFQSLVTIFMPDWS